MANTVQGMKNRNAIIAVVIAVALVLGFAFGGSGGTDTSSDSTTVVDSTDVGDSNSSSIEAPADTVAAKLASYCSALPVIAETDMNALTEAQATKAASALDSVYASLTSDMTPHAGPLLDFFLQFSQMGGLVSQVQIDHHTELNKLFIADCE